MTMVETAQTEIPRAVPAARWKAKREGINLSLVKGSGPQGVILPKDIEQVRVTQGAMETILREGRAHASTLARKLAEREGVPLGPIEGTGTRGRVMMADVERAVERKAPKVAVEEKESLFGKTFPMTQMRRVIAKRMAQSAFTAPHIYFFTGVEMDNLNRLREEILSDFEKQFKVRVSIRSDLNPAIRPSPIRSA